MKLELQAISAGYGASTVLRDVSLTVPSGSVVALLGANGAGKTTLLSVASGLIRPRGGRVVLDHRDVTACSPDDRVGAGLCHITESGAVFPALTVADNLRLFSPRGDRDAAVERAVSAFPKLGQRLRQDAGTMSGGEQRMLALARAYARRASVVMVDEVSLGLAPLVVDEIFAFLARLAHDGVSLLIVEQYVAKALAIADFVYVLARGRIRFAGETSELQSADLVREYLGAEAV